MNFEANETTTTSAIVPLNVWDGTFTARASSNGVSMTIDVVGYVDN